MSGMMGGSYGGTAQLAAAEQSVNDFIACYDLTLNQQQFDALVDLVMAYGSTILTSGYQIEKVIAAGEYTDVQLANAFCSWVKGSDGSLSQQRLNRRLREIKLFLYGSYTGVCDATFRYVIFNANGGTLDDNTVLCYAYGGTYAALPTASRSGKYFAGWYTAASGGTHLCNSDTVSQNYTVYAHWSDSAVENPNEPGATDPDPGPEPLPEPPELKTTEAGVQFIKDHEGFVEYPMWDYGQYSIGYGSRCPDDKLEEYRENGITDMVFVNCISIAFAPNTARRLNTMLTTADTDFGATGDTPPAPAGQTEETQSENPADNSGENAEYADGPDEETEPEGEEPDGEEGKNK